MAVPDRALVRWLDRCLGARIVPDALRAKGIAIKTYADLYPADDTVPDARWIPEVSRLGWVIVTKDKSIRRNPEEIAALRAADARYVCLAAAGMSGAEQAACLLTHRRTIEGVLRARRAPAIITVMRTGVQWLDGSTWRAAKHKRERADDS